MALSGRQFPIEAGAHAATIVDVGAGLRSYTVGGVDVTCRFGEDEIAPKCCGTTLAPWPNRIRGARYTFEGTTYQLGITEPAAGNAIHGLGRWVRWQKVHHTTDSVTLSLDIAPQNGYPFEVQVQTTYALHVEYGLTVTVQARNDGRTRAPFGTGAHPYLSTRGQALDQTTVQIPAAQELVLDEAQVPVGARPVAKTTHDLRRGKRLGALRLDAGFTGLLLKEGRGQAEVRTRAGGAKLWFDATYAFLQVFTREDLTPGQHGVAVEPMTCAPNAFNTGAGLIILEPGGEWTGSWGITPS